MCRATLLCFSILMLYYLCGCSNQNSEVSNKQTNQDTLFKLLSKDDTGITFNNHIEENDSLNMVDFIYMYNGGGVAIGDINNDHLPDIYFTGNIVNDRLYLNKGSWQFEDISTSAGIDIPGWSSGVTMADVNGDGFLDIYVCRSGNTAPENRKNLLYINNGDLTFSEQAESLGVDDDSYSTQAAFFDYDKDGDLDLYVLNHTNEVRNPNQLVPVKTDGSGLSNDKLYRNNGPKNSPESKMFTDVTKEAGILYDGLGLGIAVGDINEDGWDDVLVTNDFLANDYLYINNHDGTFTEMAQSYFDHVSHFSMGTDMADFNNDGHTDIITLDMLPYDHNRKMRMTGPMDYDLFEHTLEQGYMPQYMRNTLQLNNGRTDNGHPSFAEIGQLAGVQATDWSWGPLLADFNNDGLKDLFITNGYMRDVTDLDFVNHTVSLSGRISTDSLDDVLKNKARTMPVVELPNFMFQNQGDLVFQDVSEMWGFKKSSLSNGAAYADIDNDGDLDIIVNNINEPAFVYENLSDTLLQHNFLEIQLVGDSLNPFALGATVTLFYDGNRQVKRQAVTRGYQSSVDYKLHFGLGNVKQIDSLHIVWPDGKFSAHYSPEVNKIITINKNEIPLYLHKPKIKVNKPFFHEVTDKYGLNFKHKDPEYNDFSRQFLLPHKQSQQGPGIAVADINDDGLEDFFIGGGHNQNGQLFFQTVNGKFKKASLSGNPNEKQEEDTGVLFFDYDNDGDQDLYIVSGSNEFYANSEYYSDRLYRNDGKGHFTLDTEAIPDLRFSGSCVTAADFDQDGDLDLFIGGRLVPLKYPLPPDSYLFVNENGKFTDRTDDLAPALRRIGMVTDALWTDFDNDLDTDLILVGEFMPVQFFKNSNGKLENVSGQTGLRYSSGWWNSINSGDFDQDGDVDYILGNLGLNTPYNVSPQEPLTAYAIDLDRNGIIDPIITYHNNNVEYPIHRRDDIMRQMPGLKKKFPDYISYAKADISDILSSEDKSRSYIVRAFHFTSSLVKNEGNGHFTMHDLPTRAQLAPVYGIIVQDFDYDGFPDLLLSGNDFGTEVITGRYDASKGLLLTCDGQGGFKNIPSLQNGLAIDGNARSAASIVINGELTYLFTRNSDKLKAFTTQISEHQGALLPIPASVMKAKIKYQDGTERIQEFYYGSSYLSQSSRTLPLNGQEEHVVLYNYLGEKTLLDKSMLAKY